MEMTSSRKKIILAAILTSGLTLAISQASLAQNAPAGPSASPEVKGKMASPPCLTNLNPEMQKIHDKFLTDTMPLRKQITEKHAVMRSLMNAQSPDTAKISQLAGELFELREQLRLKAQEAGLPMMGCMGGMGMGPGMGHGMGMGRGMGMQGQ